MQISKLVGNSCGIGDLESAGWNGDYPTWDRSRETS